MIGVDTSILVDFFQGKENIVNWFSENKDMIYVSELVVYEFLCGNLTSLQKEQFLGFISQIPTLKFDRNSTIKSSEIFRNCKKNGREIHHPDAMIAGNYLANNINKIVTNNIKHFQNIEEIKIIEI